jgi:hypothetical protein
MADEAALGWPVRAPLAVGDRKEFARRGWSLDRLRRLAAACLRGETFPDKGYRAVERWVVFYRDRGGKLAARFVASPQEDGEPAREVSVAAGQGAYQQAGWGG